MNLKNLLIKAVGASIEGGHAIMDIYDSNFSIEHKKDNTPLTLADTTCHEKIIDRLQRTNIPILSEEGSEITYQERKSWEYFWLVDPLDGTKEFIKRNGEFTVNIALISKGKPIIGVVYAPVKQEIYFALEKLGSFKTLLSNLEEKHIINDLSELISLSYQLPITNKRDVFTIVGSRSHMTLETKEFFQEMKDKHGDIEIIKIGSSLKICMVAEGRADLYVRYAPTMEWDTAAGDAIARYAGFNLIQHNTSENLVYNKENLLNPWFLVK